MKGARFRREESVGLLFWQVSTLWQRAVKAALRPFGLTHTQYVILAVIAELGESGGDITHGWTKDDKTMIACCNDGTRPVIFKIERIDCEE